MDIQKAFGRYWALKIVLFPVFLFLNLFYFPYLYCFYRQKLKKVSSQQQLFFQARQEYGAILELLYYIHCWTNVRSDAVLVVFDPQIELIKKLASQICPSVKVICPPVLISNFIQKALGVFIRRFVFPPLYYHSLRKYPEAIYIYEINEGSRCAYVKYLDKVYKDRTQDSPFWEAYVQTPRLFDRRFEVCQDFIQLAEVSDGISVETGLVNRLKKDLKVSGKYVVININVKDYSNENQNIRRIQHFERYNVLIDCLISRGYFVVLQGKGEQPFFSPRDGFIDYSHSVFQSVENDLSLFGGCDFFISSKSGAETYSLLFDKPILGLNYTELCAMLPNVRFRFFPKRIKGERGKYLSWQTVLSHPAYFQLGRTLPTQEKLEYIEMEEGEILEALVEFLLLLPKPREEWVCYSTRQKEFKNMLNPGHMDLFHISGVPCDAYLKEAPKATSV